MPRQTIAKNATKAANSGALDLIGVDSKDYKEVKFDSVIESLYEVALAFIKVARENLESADKVSSGGLSDSIIPLETTINGKIYTIQISIASYYDFVNKGVKGWQRGGGNSPYQFKHPQKGGSGSKQSKFVNSIRKWLIREGLSQRAKEVGHKKSNSRDSVRKRRATNTDTSTRTAIVIASQIRRHGIEPTGFWDKALIEVDSIMSRKFGEAFKYDIISNLIN